MKRICLLMLAAWMLLFAAAAHAEYWADDVQRALHCEQEHPGCEVLQMVMTGSFGRVDEGDKLSIRVMSAALAQLSAVSETDFEHFMSYADVDADVLRENYYIALGNCLLADILLDPGQEGQEEQVRRVLRLFLNPSAEWNAQLQMDVIRKQADQELIELMARTVALPPEFIAYVIGEPEQDAAQETAQQ